MFKLTDKSKNILKIIGIILFLIYIFSLCLSVAVSTRFNSAPDEKMKYDVCKYLCDNLKLPHGGEESIRDQIWGFSYAFTPILAYMFSAVFMRITMLFTQNEFALIVSARMISVISIVRICNYEYKNIKKIIQRESISVAICSTCNIITTTYLFGNIYK